MIFQVSYNEFGVRYVSANSYGQAETVFRDWWNGVWKEDDGSLTIKAIELLGDVIEEGANRKGGEQ